MSGDELMRASCSDRIDPAMRGKGSIAEWYKGRSIFITGSSGFMGKVLLEKLLYACPGIKNIYILLRPKRGKTPDQRLGDMWNLPVFKRMREVEPSAIKKIVICYGDVTSKDLGLSAEQRQILINNVSVIFHMAATLRLEAKLKDAIEMNTAGTDRMITLAKEMKNLKALIHLSTAFCSADIDVFEERVYPSPANPRDIIDVCRWMKDDALETATPALIAPHPNTYTFSKRLAETLISNEFSNLPVAIVRPAIVIPCGVEPISGWVDTLNGPMGLVAGAGKGVIRSMHVTGTNRAQVVPCDIAISATIAVAWKIGCGKFKFTETPVYNLTNDEVQPMCWAEVLERGRKIAYEYPFEMQIWYPDGDIRSSWIMHKLCCIFMHWIPAYLIDFLMFIFRQKRFMVRLMGKIDDGLELLQFFTTREWIFRSKNFLGLLDDMSPEDQKQFPIDFNAMPVEEYLKLALLGTRKYCMKEDLSTIPRCRRVQTCFYVLDRAFALAFYLGIIWLLCSCSDTIKGMFETVGSYAKHIPILGLFLPSRL